MPSSSHGEPLAKKARTVVSDKQRCGSGSGSGAGSDDASKSDVRSGSSKSQSEDEVAEEAPPKAMSTSIVKKKRTKKSPCWFGCDSDHDCRLRNISGFSSSGQRMACVPCARAYSASKARVNYELGLWMLLVS